MSTQDNKDDAVIVDSSDGGDSDNSASELSDRPSQQPTEIGGRGGLDPTRYGDWEKAGRCIDF